MNRSMGVGEVKRRDEIVASATGLTGVPKLTLGGFPFCAQCFS